MDLDEEAYGVDDVMSVEFTSKMVKSSVKTENNFTFGFYTYHHRHRKKNTASHLSDVVPSARAFNGRDFKSFSFLRRIQRKSRREEEKSPQSQFHLAPQSFAAFCAIHRRAVAAIHVCAPSRIEFACLQQKTYYVAQPHHVSRIRKMTHKISFHFFSLCPIIQHCSAASYHLLFSL